MTDYENPPLEEIAAVLEGATLRNGEVRGRCPAHGGDNEQALSVRYVEGRLMISCHTRNCEFADVWRILRERLRGSGASGRETGGRISVGKGGPKSGHPEGRRVWRVRDANGKLVALHVRDDLEDGGKRVWWKLPSGKAGLGGRSTADLPLYGSEDLGGGEWVVVAEGEKAADALKDAGIRAVGTVTGAEGCPGPEALSVLKGRRVVLWPDGDEPGFSHMGKVAEALAGIASEIRWFEWEDAPSHVKGPDAADHPDPSTLLPALKVAPRWSRPPAIPGRALLGRAIERGVEPPEELLPDVLLAAKAHNIYAPGGVGKTWVLVWLATELVRRGKRVVVFDLENGLRTYAERFEEMGADPAELDERLFYYPFPALDRASYERMLDEDSPDVVLFDSWIGFLAADGRDENVSNDISAWADAYSKPALRRGAAIVVLDHVPHDHERERGSSRKRDEMDVVWKLTKIGDFDRERTAALSMLRQKDREGWLPEKLTFEIGGDADTGRFVMRRDDGLAIVVGEASLNDREQAALAVLQSFGSDGATTAEWFEETRRQTRSTPVEVGHKQSLHKLRRALIKKGKVAERDGRYVPIEAQDVGGVSGVSGVYPDTLGIPQNRGAPGGVSGVPPLKGGSTRLDTPPSAASPAPAVVVADTPPDHKPFTELSSEEKRERFRENVRRFREGR